MKIIKRILKWLLGIAFILAGINHFLNANFYLKMMPPYLPRHLFLIYLSGVFEIALGVLLLIPKFTRFAAWGLIALLIAVFPANIFMAFNPQMFPEFSRLALYARLPLQFVLIAWAYWFTLEKKS
ncbi:DoxX family protein [soil metagenome]